jgi:hypothetical protein
MRNLLLLTVCSAALGMAQSGRLTPPVLGYVPGPESGTLLRIAGIPGAAVAEPFFESGALGAMEVSPLQNFALALRRDDGAPMIVRFDRGDAGAEPIGGLGDGFDRIALSADGRAAALYSQSQGVIRVVSGLPDQPLSRRALSAAPLGGRAGLMAVSGEGELVLAASASIPGEVLVFGGDSAGRLALPGPIRSMAFAPGQRRAVIVAGAEVYLADAAPGGEMRKLAGREQGLADPAQALFSRDGARVYVADPGAQAVHILNLAQDSIEARPCPGAAALLQPLEGNAVFRLGSPAAGYLQILDDDAGAARVLLAPRAQPVSH